MNAIRTRWGVRGLVGALAVVVALAGCGSDGRLALSADASGVLAAHVDTVRDRAAAGDKAGALAELDRMRQTLAAQQAQDDASPERAAEIGEAIDAVAAEVAQLPDPPPPPTTSPPPPPKQDDGDDKDDDDEGKGNGKGKD